MRGKSTAAARGKRSRRETTPEPIAQEPPQGEGNVALDTMGLTGLNHVQKVNWGNLIRPKREVQCTKFIDKDFLGKLGLMDGFREMMARAGLEGMLDYHPPTYKRCVYEFLSTLTIVNGRGGKRILFRMHDDVREATMPQIRTAFGWAAPSTSPPFELMSVGSPVVGDFWYAISGSPLNPSGDRISSIRHPALRIAAYFIGMTIFCKGETGKLSQLEMCYLRSLLPGSTGIPDWVDLWLSCCLDARTKLSGNLSMGGMITRLITHLKCPPTDACGKVPTSYLLLNANTLRKMTMLKKHDDPPYKVSCGERDFIFLPKADLPFGPELSDFLIASDTGEDILDAAMEGDDDDDADYEPGEGSGSSSFEARLDALTLQSNATMGYMRHLDGFFQRQYPDTYTAYGAFPGDASGSGASGSGGAPHDGD